MEVKNKVEFSKSAVNKKTEQEITEGVLANDETEERSENTEAFESDMSTEPVTINVKPIPAKTKPASFDGAVGLFTIAADAVKNKLLRDEGDVLEITISGKGNFVQINAPTVQWPAGVEGFEPSVKDSLEKIISPLTGSRTYRYAFIAATAGAYTIPAISFSFFNPDSGNYRTVSTHALQVNIDNTKNAIGIDLTIKQDKKSSNMDNYLFVGGILLLSIGGLLWFLRNRKIESAQKKAQLSETEITVLSVKEVLAPATLLVHGDDKQFYSLLRQSVWSLLGSHFTISGSELNKENIVAKMKESNLDKDVIGELQTILHQCEAGIFTNAHMAEDKAALLFRTKKILETIHPSTGSGLLL